MSSKFCFSFLSVSTTLSSHFFVPLYRLGVLFLFLIFFPILSVSSILPPLCLFVRLYLSTVLCLLYLPFQLSLVVTLLFFFAYYVYSACFLILPSCFPTSINSAPSPSGLSFLLRFLLIFCLRVVFLLRFTS